MKEFDVVVIGSGPGGYVCAIRMAQLGFKTAIVEKYPTLGGTCLNVGCIPSKAWLESSERFYDATHHFVDHGIETGKVKVDISKMSARVQKVVSDTCGGIDFLMKKNKIEVLRGLGSLKDKNTVIVKGEKEEIEVKAKNIVLATGSKPSTLPFIKIDKERVITSTEALKLKEVPKHLIVIGGGVIGLEMGQVFLRLGSKVSVVEYADSMIAAMDAELGKTLQRVLKKQGMEFYAGHGVTAVEAKGKKVTVTAKKNKDGKEVTLESDYCLVAVGRRPFTDGLGLENAGVQVDERGVVVTDSNLRTSVDNIFAIGDIVKGPMLAHKAEEEGVYVAELLAGQKPHLNYNLIPGVVYTWPEVSSVGQTEEQLKSSSIPYKKGSFPFKASGRARAGNESEGLVKVLAHKETDEILGVHMIGARCADLIGEAVVAMEFRASAEDIARICHGHPTYTECFKEACLAATEDRAIHI
ncbi:dihydrolipoyl dehydrogenase [Halobacteriovorax sp. JY17]|uniref:dihydrolipoyl dehydrogenase n=1 Tax=Halobacteriovorax sp. JY17 TaxID=2014617 RepID=UPI000C3AA290|nr:dihydrolipoyl dehydrogenase [Halobacteriovorax sp. JY17]PIK16177.1 MAG: dihydrolipoyl dehydrogenase [Halobacteriovorax sp. JY17]